MTDLAYAPISHDAIEFIRRHAPNGVCEIGAGDGVWTDALNAAGITTIGYDIAPRGNSVRLGDHFTASTHQEMALLIVWPPDGPTVQDYIRVWRGETILICADMYRIMVGHALEQFVESARFPEFLYGRKGRSILAVYSRR